MSFDHRHQVGPRLAASLVNARSDDAIEPLLREHGVREPALTSFEGEELRGWAQRLRAVFTTPDVQERCDEVNELLATVAGSLVVATHDGMPPHLHLVPDDSDVVTRVRSVTTGGLAFFLSWAAGRRMGVCAREHCEQVFIDESRAGRQRYCSARCGNTDAVARHRRR
ncbi:CGNR zinc finger protein [Rathayibacter sp. PhB127]|uniref:CGNR zinc finger domain-containing protein n=1 Tax=Rathayibacter sp. PhB127 TaxID=2485176 RepID=UPI000F4BD626|nr:CGNR zinc finger domain-containing protein [Rathayibacter sp. PhB127]ROS30021.1 CGNR zinc finger protein [Rathayibacter sp. PhB127]